jgi:hypothetical protein
VNEYVLPVFLTDEPIPFFVTEPLNRTASQSLDLLKKKLLGSAARIGAPANARSRSDRVDPKKNENPTPSQAMMGRTLLSIFGFVKKKLNSAHP